MTTLFRYASSPAIVPQAGCDWADTMVLNPAMIKDPKSDHLHMLFRATGPWPKKQMPGKPLPYPIFLGYACSDDLGKTWQADFSRPALTPVMGYDKDEIYIKNIDGRCVVNYANGCIEDPRLHYIEEMLYLTVACRMFPPGPYWEHDEPTQCCPAWIKDTNQPFGIAARTNLTVTVLYQVDLGRLKAKDYEHAFVYVTHLTDPEVSDNRDAFLFPEKLTIDGQSQYVMIHRPREPQTFPSGRPSVSPSIFIGSAVQLEDFPTSKASHQLLAEPMFDWEGNRIGGSIPPIKISANEWLLGYHGKKDDILGYTQSFMILRQMPNELPTVIHRCPERLMYAQQPWELAGRFKIPCVFSCSGVVVDETLVIGYGAADERVGIAWVKLKKLIAMVKKYDAKGRKI
jgi:predicted GH43/DUF377 family glycosyl hydrolase